MCERGCCSIRWKLDYAGNIKQTKDAARVTCYVRNANTNAALSTTEFQNYFKYAEVSPYVVVQDKTQQCDCVMCHGLADTSPPQRRWKELKKESNSTTDGSLTDDEPERPESP